MNETVRFLITSLSVLEGRGLFSFVLDLNLFRGNP